MRSDNLPVIIIKHWPLEATLFDGEQLAGPVPSLYSEDPDAAQAAIKGEPLKAHWDLNKIAKSFFMVESVTTTEALAVIKKPRYIKFYFIYLYHIE